MGRRVSDGLGPGDVVMANCLSSQLRKPTSAIHPSTPSPDTSSDDHPHTCTSMRPRARPRCARPGNHRLYGRTQMSTARLQIRPRQRLRRPRKKLRQMLPLRQRLRGDEESSSLPPRPRQRLRVDEESVASSSDESKLEAGTSTASLALRPRQRLRGDESVASSNDESKLAARTSAASACGLRWRKLPLHPRQRLRRHMKLPLRQKLRGPLSEESVAKSSNSNPLVM